MWNLAPHLLLSDSDEQDYFSMRASSTAANHGDPRVWRDDCAQDWTHAEPRQLTSHITHTSRTHCKSDLWLSGPYQLESVWSADRRPSASATRTADQISSGFFRPLLLPLEQEISHDRLRFGQLYYCPLFCREQTPTCECHSLNHIPAKLVTYNPSRYNQDWSLQDMIMFNVLLRDESEILCQWVANTTLCNDRVKGMDLTSHLQHKHRAMSDSQAYSCSWNLCPVSRPMMKSSLERHIKEQHIPVKWACPTCTKTFSRKATLMGHFERCPCRV